MCSCSPHVLWLKRRKMERKKVRGKRVEIWRDGEIQDGCGTRAHVLCGQQIATFVCLCVSFGFSHFLPLSLPFLQFDINQLMTSVNVSQSLSPIHKPLESPSSVGSGSHSGSVGGGSGVGVEQSPVDRTKGFFPDESEPLLRCDSTSSKDSALSRNGSFITKGERTDASVAQQVTAGYLRLLMLTSSCSTYQRQMQRAGFI